MSLVLYFVLTFDLLYYIYTQDTNLCTPLLQYGVYDTYKNNHKADATYNYKQDFCDSYNKYISKNKSVGVRADIIQKFGFGVSNADQEIEALHTLVCNNGEFSITSTEFTDYSSSVLSTEALTIYKDCVTENNKGLKVTTFISPDSKNVNINMWYVEVGTNPHTAISGIIISPPDSWSCNGSLWDDTKQGTESIDLGSVSLDLVCSRKFSAFPYYNEDGDLVHSDASSIIISTDRGDVIRSFASIFEQSDLEKALKVINPQISRLQSRIKRLTKEITTITTDLHKTKMQSGMFTKEMFLEEQRYSAWSEYIKFPVKFEQTPELVYGLASFMTWHEKFTMVLTDVADLTETGFTLTGTPCCAPDGDHGETWLYKIYWVAYLT